MSINQKNFDEQSNHDFVNNIAPKSWLYSSPYPVHTRPPPPPTWTTSFWLTSECWQRPLMVSHRVSKSTRIPIIIHTKITLLIWLVVAPYSTMLFSKLCLLICSSFSSKPPWKQAVVNASTSIRAQQVTSSPLDARCPTANTSQPRSKCWLAYWSLQRPSNGYTFNWLAIPTTVALAEVLCWQPNITHIYRPGKCL